MNLWVYRVKVVLALFFKSDKYKEYHKEYYLRQKLLKQDANELSNK
jgi:hypothetical protein